MAKKKFDHTSLTNKELELIKDLYIDQKVKSMNNDELKNFAKENITLQIKSTIGNEEEIEAWDEMESFFKEDFENIIKSVQIQFHSEKELDLKTNEMSKKEMILDSTNKDDSKKIDMWED
tara:strand:- start:8053 stop:8412 length:360 start_codon:yes stop_codon:yes gene_type:complete